MRPLIFVALVVACGIPNEHYSSDTAPSGLVYATNPAIYTKNVAIAPNSPSSSGGAVVSYSVSPALPTGLTLNTASGVITGTPTTTTATASYSVTATNGGGSTSVSLSIQVTDQLPVDLSYSTNPAHYIKGFAIIANTPMFTGGPATSYSVSPALPAGLSFDTSTGVITGTPTVVTAASNHVVTATLTGNVAIGNLSVGIFDAAGVIAAGYQHTCAIVNGGAQCWGLNASGQLGNGSTTDSPVPVQVTGLTTGVQFVTAGEGHSGAIVNGGIQTWGGNPSGQLGDNTTTNSSVPVQVTGLTSGAQALAAGFNHTCALVSGGAQCWGSNSQGELGNGTTTDSPVPVTVSGLSSGGSAIACGGTHACAIASGSVVCWGFNAVGQLGDGTTANSSTRVTAQPLTSGGQGVGGGQAHTCALVNGGVFCWGSNGFGCRSRIA